MSMLRGYYSIVQYCPDRSRAEYVNLGLVLLRPQPHAVRVRMTAQLGRVKRLFELNEADQAALIASVDAMAFRIEQMAYDLKDSADLAEFASSRANDLRLTEPRPVMLGDIDEDIDNLFTTLID